MLKLKDPTLLKQQCYLKGQWLDADNGGQGVALAEVYDASDNPQSEYQRLVDISTRGPVTSGEGVLIGGFSVTGNSPKKVLVRGVGPGLTAYGVSGALTT